jgi:hypothetical protein
MRTHNPMRMKFLLLLATIGLVVATAAGASQIAVWTPRTLSQFSPPIIPEAPDKLGARASHLHVDARRCYAAPGSSVDVSFSVLAPTAKTGNKAATAAVEARWQTVQLSREVDAGAGAKFIALADCGKINVGLSAQVLMPAQQLAASPRQ